MPAVIQDWIEAVFHPEVEKRFPVLSWLWSGGLYLVGLYLLAFFLNFGRIPFSFEDWAEVTAPRLAFLQDAILKGILPLHVNGTSALRGFTDRYLSIPDLNLAPQVLLLHWVDIGTFILINTLLIYSIGMLGLFWLRRRFSLSLFSFTLLFFLFNFNGHILSHLSIGHANWAAYFLFPWLVIQTFRLLDGRSGWVWVAQTALLLFSLFILGAFHQFVWWLIFLGLVALVSWHHFFTIAKTLVFAMLLSMVRILPAALVAGQYGDEFISGYPTVTHLLWAMLLPRGPWEALKLDFPFSTLSWWEFDLFIGAIGTAFLFLFGVIFWIRSRKSTSSYFVLALPLLVMVALSIGRTYSPLMHLPMLAGERVSSRIISLPFTFILVFAAITFQNWLDQHRPLSWLMKLTAVVLAGLQIQDQWMYIKLWKVGSAAANLPVIPLDLTNRLISNHSDPPYTQMLAVGACVSVISFLLLAGLVWWEWRKRIYNKTLM